MGVDAATLRERLRSCGDGGLRGRLLGGESAEAPSTADILFRARYECYLVLGFTDEQAFWLATVPAATVAGVMRLTERGCPHDTAVRILA